MTAKARDVYLAACAAISERFAADGFRFIKSARAMRRKGAELTEEVSFESSSLNRTGAHVALLVHVYLRSPLLEELRKSRSSPFVGGDVVGGGQLGNIRPERAWQKYELADDFGAVVETVCDDIRTVALPFFALAADRDALADALTQRDVPGIAPSGRFAVARAVEYFVAFSRAADAQRIFSAWCQRHVDVVGGDATTGFAKEVALIRSHYGLTG